MKAFYDLDTWLAPYTGIIDYRNQICKQCEYSLVGNGSLADFSLGYLYYGLHRTDSGWVFREYAPNATDIFLISEHTNWCESNNYRLNRLNDYGDWGIILPAEALSHRDLFKLLIYWNNGKGERLPSYVHRVVQDSSTKIYCGQVWSPEEPYRWQVENFKATPEAPLIYEAHIGMATEEMKVGSYSEFTKNIIPRIVSAGYNTIQLMAIQEHPYYGSFGYHVSNFFAASSRFGTPEELKELIDTAHQNGLRVIMDLIHSHSAKNIDEGLGLFDGSDNLYFHSGSRRFHRAWDSLCFDYGKTNVKHFLLSNCHYWLDEYKFDGFRFDGITSMIYFDHGLERNFTKYDQYYDGEQDIDALSYLYLSNRLIHSINPSAITIAEEMSGMPGIAAPTEQKGYGFDYRMSMGIPDYWIKLTKEINDDCWDMGSLAYELTTHRAEEKVISYCESHDQALVGDQTLFFRMLQSDIYDSMKKECRSLSVDRGIALHKMIRLITFANSGGGYLNFMGNEFGHPEWIDFPREGNNWSYMYARRQWSLADDPTLKFEYLAAFDKAITSLEKNYHILANSSPEILYTNNNDKIIAISRGDLLFVFNFNPTQSFYDYGIPCQGKFRIIAHTDRPEYGGFDRIDDHITYLSQHREEHYKINSPILLYLYLPSRTAIVLHKEPHKNAFDV